MIQFAGIAVLVVMLMVGLIITMASMIGYFICCKRGTQYKLGNKIMLRTSFIIGISITLFPVMFFYIIASNNRKQDEQALIREQQAIEEANAYDENNNIMEVFFEKDNMTGFRLIVTDSAAGSKYYELEKTIDRGKNWTLANADPFDGRLGLAEGIMGNLKSMLL